MTIDYEDIWHISNEYRIQQKKEEWLEFLRRLPPSMTILEIGAYNGGCSYSFLQFADRLITIDLHRKAKYSLDDPRHTYIGGNSHTPVIEQQISKLNLSFNLLFIDGDHTYAGVKQDYRMYSKYLTPTGMCVFHDIVDSEGHRRQNCYVSKLWNEIKRPESIEIISEPFTWGGIGIL